MLKFLTCLIQLIISPAKGWEDIAAVGEEPRKICSDGFYPLLGLTACSVFTRRLYDSDLGLVTMIQGRLSLLWSILSPISLRHSYSRYSSAK